MGKGSPPPPAQTTQTTEPPKYAQEGLQLAADEAIRLYEQGGMQYFPGSTVVPFSPETQQALQLTEERALAGSPLVDAAQLSAQDIVEGRGVNPFLAGAVEAAIAPIEQQFLTSILPGITSSFAGIGRTGSGAQNTALQQAVEGFGRGIGQAAAPLAFQSAENEAARQLQAIGLSPQLASQDYIDINALLGVGQANEAQQAAILQDEINRFNFEQQAQQAALNDLLGVLTGASAGYGTNAILSPGVAQPSAFLTGAGGALSGAATGAMVGGPVGAGIGGAIGLLGGLL